MTTHMKVLPLLVTIALLTLSLNGCMSDTEEDRLRKPLHLTVRVNDDNGEPLANTAIKIHQLVPAGDKFFCLSIPTLAGGGKSCANYKRFPIFKGEFPASGSLDFTAEYLTGLYIEIAESCDKADPKTRRRYFRRTMYTGDLMDKEIITMNPLDKAYLGYYIRYEPCTTRTPPVENWDDYY
ncbi:hypothetical protein ALP23_01099 [Pseudomonas syringae pv. apii]|uniref:Lipoprotein n=4 Tax=Pseudomonas TaxID=286 RepID=A0A3M5X117_9PSED|nr:hypothetical protein ALP23_01099 [Pseudomonas syringae pv. apii]